MFKTSNVLAGGEGENVEETILDWNKLKKDNAYALIQYWFKNKIAIKKILLWQLEKNENGLGVSY